MEEAGFYKIEDNGTWLFAPHNVFLPCGIELNSENYQEHTYPVEGWTWHSEAPADYLAWINEQNLEYDTRD